MTLRPLAFFIFLCLFSPCLASEPKVSIITSIFDGDEFIEGFLADIVQQTLFDECELILINAASPGNEEEVINKYCARYPNIRYVKLEKDPGIYAVWNHAIKISSSAYLTSANLDDRSKFDALEKHVALLEEDDSIDLIYSDYMITELPNETFDNNHYRWVTEAPEFSPKNMYRCLPGPRPVWRKSLHKRFGYFDESYSSSGDYEFWNRIVSKGAKFKKLSEACILYYFNPNGISTNQDESKATVRAAEDLKIRQQYGHMWQ